MSRCVERLVAAVEAAADEPARRAAMREGFAELRREVGLHPRGRGAAAVFEAASATARAVGIENLPLGLAVVMHLYPLCALGAVPIPWWSPAGFRRRALLRDIEQRGLILANAGSERAEGVPSPLWITQEGSSIRVSGRFDYVSLANVADLMLFAAPMLGQTVFCIAAMRGAGVHVDAPRFGGSMRVSDTCSVRFENVSISAGNFVRVPNHPALECMTNYQRAWFHLLLADTYLARIRHLREQWKLPHSPADAATFNELALLRDHALGLLNGAQNAPRIDALFRVTAALKLRVSWQAQATAALVREFDEVAAKELGYIQRQPTSDDRILQSIGTAMNGAKQAEKSPRPCRFTDAFARLLGKSDPVS